MSGWLSERSVYVLPTHPILGIGRFDLDGSIHLRVAARLGINSSRYLFSIRRTEIADYRRMLVRTRCPARTPLAKSVALRLTAPMPPRVVATRR